MLCDRNNSSFSFRGSLSVLSAYCGNNSGKAVTGCMASRHVSAYTNQAQLVIGKGYGNRDVYLKLQPLYQGLLSTVG